MGIFYKRLSLLFLLFIVIGYSFYNLSQDVKIQQIPEKEYKIYALKFDDLPHSEKQKYISKEHVFEYGDYITPKSLLENLENDSDENLSKIEKLEIKNKRLVDDNMDLSEKNLELSLKLNSLKNELKIQNDELKNKNTQNLSLIENKFKQDLTDMNNSLKEAQSELLETQKSYEQKIIKLQNQISELKSVYDKNITAVLLIKDSNISRLASENLKLNDELKELTQKEKEGLKTKKELKNLQAEIEDGKKDFQSLLDSHQKEIDRIKSGFDMQKVVLEDELSRKSNTIIDLKDKILNLEKDAKGKEDSLKKIKDENSKINLENLRLNKELNSSYQQISKNKDAIASLNSQISAINLSLKQEQENLKTKNKEFANLDKILLKLNKELEDKDKNISNLKLELAKLNNQNDKIKLDIKEKEKNIQSLEYNSSILNSLIIKKDKELEILKQASQTDMRNYQILKKQIDELKILADKNAGVKKLQSELALLKQELSKKSSETLSNKDMIKKLNELEIELENGLDKQDLLEDENENLKLILEAQTKPEVPKKLVFVSQIECVDVEKDRVSQMCKNRVSDFLGRYNSNYIYEIIPIVDGRGYSLPYEVASKVSKDELKRLNNYVDFGVGKERANMASSLIKDEFGEFARISFNTEVVRKENSRGFIIKAYR